MNRANEPPATRRRRMLTGLVAIGMAALAGCESPPPSSPAPAAAKPAVMPASAVADRVVVVKSRHTLELLNHGRVLQAFPVSLGPHAKGPKRAAGDGRTPEGVYRIDGRTERTKYTRALHISYPNGADRARAQAENAEPGGGIYIHGVPRDYGPYDPPERFHDWTDGCIAVGNAAIVKIWNEVPDGTPIEILP
ncbi:MAG: L,D-transpeptidase family protein [Alphaproteobacteria bacterium]|nr:L,D-transpeptidase family protein [Alphaproteobacteria bacterium]MBV9552808.1 L,D-transpeptidase family protein [Alphaproteobacteria bacterium]